MIPRWSGSSLGGTPVDAIKGDPGSGSMVGVGPPLFASGPSMGSPIIKLIPDGNPALDSTEFELKLMSNVLIPFLVREISLPVA